MRLVTTLLLLTTLASSARAADPEALTDAHRALASAVQRGEVKDMLRARAQFAGLSAADPQDAQALYGVALASWRAVPLLTEVDKGEAKKVCEGGITAIDRALKLDKRSGEAVALKVGLQGLWIGFNPGAAMMLGMEMEEAMGRAEALAPASPRVVLLKGMNTLHKPAFVGGGADKAMPLFERAIALAATESASDRSAAAWGHDDVHVWAGRCAEKLGKLDEAVTHYRHALEVTPDHGWTRAILLPRAEKALAAASRR